MISVSLTTALNAYENSGSGLFQTDVVHKMQDGSKTKPTYYAAFLLKIPYFSISKH